MASPTAYGGQGARQEIDLVVFDQIRQRIVISNVRTPFQHVSEATDTQDVLVVPRVVFLSKVRNMHFSRSRISLDMS